jgi:hypothetical protein
MIYKIYNVLNHILYISVTLKTCLSKYDKESKLTRSQISFEFYYMFNNGIRNVTTLIKINKNIHMYKKIK